MIGDRKMVVGEQILDVIGVIGRRYPGIERFELAA